MSKIARVSLVGAFLIAVVVLAGCGSSSGGSSNSGGGSNAGSGSTVLRTAFTADPSPLDPDTFYEAEALPAMVAMYEGLVTYAPDSSEIVPALATKWKISPDGRTYTFTLREGVEFSDGTPFDAKAAMASFQRRIDLEGGPSYMLAEVEKMEAPSADTFVVKLKRPQAPFMDYLASPYGPVMTSPTAVEAHAKGGDMAAGWMGSHSAGTGPYVLGTIKRGTSYELKANPRYWGEAPHFKTVIFNVIPNVATQRLEVENGQLDLVFDDQNPRDLAALEQNSKVQVEYFPALFKTAVWVNPESEVFGPAKSRAGLRAALDNEQISEEILGPSAKPSTEVYPPGMLPKGAAPDLPAYEPEKLAEAMAPYKGKKVTVGYYQSLGALQSLAGNIQVQLQELGLEATTRAYAPAVLFGLPENPSERPDLIAVTFNPDAVSPDTFARIYWYKEAPVNLLGCTSPEGDKLLDQAAAKPTNEAAVPLNVKAAEAYRASNCWLNIADVEDVVIARAGITNFVHQLPWVLTVRLASLKEE